MRQRAVAKLRWLQNTLSYPSVCRYDSTSEGLDGFGWDLVWRLYDRGQTENSNFRFPTNGNHKMAEEETCGLGCVK